MQECFYHIGDGNADLRHLCWQPQKILVLCIPADQCVLGIENGKSLRHVVDRRLQEFTVVLHGSRCFIEQLHSTA